ncbi:MAG: hypothetical protein WDW38_001555 [Sanguina aurantia]
MAIGQQCTSVPNIRDLSEALPTIKAGRVLRCSNPALASAADMRLLLEEFGIRELVDLRSTEELSEDKNSSLFESARLTRFSRSWWSGQTFSQDLTVSTSVVSTGNNGSSSSSSSSRGSSISGTSSSGSSSSGGSSTNGSSSNTSSSSSTSYTLGQSVSLVRTQVSLLERSRFYLALAYKLPVTRTVPALLLSGISRAWSRGILIKDVNDGGLRLLYEILLDSAMPEIAQVLELVLLALEGGRPIMFFCKAGKDRTGLVAALILTCCNASEEEIVTDYARSNAFKMVALAGIEKRPELAGLDKSRFEGSPPEAMEGALAYAKLRYGSLGQYMQKAGFTAEKQKRLGALLCESG